MIRIFRWQLLILLLVIPAAVACADDEPASLKQAADAVGDMLKPINLSHSMFTVAFPDGKPSQYVSYLFSDMGAAEWPPSEDWVDEIEREQMQAIGQTLWPADVAVVPLKPDLSQGQQLVISYDDELGVVIAEGYVDPLDGPALTREWKLPKVEPALGIEAIFQANLDEGLSYQSFPAP